MSEEKIVRENTNPVSNENQTKEEQNEEKPKEEEFTLTSFFWDTIKTTISTWGKNEILNPKGEQLGITTPATTEEEKYSSQWRVTFNF
jgi:hypothetical protein